MSKHRPWRYSKLGSASRPITNKKCFWLLPSKTGNFMCSKKAHGNSYNTRCEFPCIFFIHRFSGMIETRRNADPERHRTSEQVSSRKSRQPRNPNAFHTEPWLKSKRPHLCGVSHLQLNINFCQSVERSSVHPLQVDCLTPPKTCMNELRRPAADHGTERVTRFPNQQKIRKN